MTGSGIPTAQTSNPRCNIGDDPSSDQGIADSNPA
jgi:hypothetical protein